MCSHCGEDHPIVTEYILKFDSEERTCEVYIKNDDEPLEFIYRFVNETGIVSELATWAIELRRTADLFKRTDEALPENGPVDAAKLMTVLQELNDRTKASGN